MKNQKTPMTSQVPATQGREMRAAFGQALYQVLPICDALRREFNRMPCLQLQRMCSSGLHH